MLYISKSEGACKMEIVMAGNITREEFEAENQKRILAQANFRALCESDLRLTIEAHIENWTQDRQRQWYSNDSTNRRLLALAREFVNRHKGEPGIDGYALEFAGYAAVRYAEAIAPKAAEAVNMHGWMVVDTFNGGVRSTHATKPQADSASIGQGRVAVVPRNYTWQWDQRRNEFVWSV